MRLAALTISALERLDAILEAARPRPGFGATSPPMTRVGPLHRSPRKVRERALGVEKGRQTLSASSQIRWHFVRVVVGPRRVGTPCQGEGRGFESRRPLHMVAGQSRLTR